MSDRWERVQRLAKRVMIKGHPDREVQQAWADELACAVVNIKEPPELERVIAGIKMHLEDMTSEVTGSPTGAHNMRVYSEVPDWTLRQWLAALTGDEDAFQEGGTTSDGEEKGEVGVVQGASDRETGGGS